MDLASCDGSLYFFVGSGTEMFFGMDPNERMPWPPKKMPFLLSQSFLE